MNELALNRLPLHGEADGTDAPGATAEPSWGAIPARAGSFLLAAAMTLAGCSSEQTYRSLQSMEQSRCVDWPAHLYDQCLESSDATYREYQDARQRAENASG